MGEGEIFNLKCALFKFAIQDLSIIYFCLSEICLNSVFDCKITIQKIYIKIIYQQVVLLEILLQPFI